MQKEKLTQSEILEEAELAGLQKIQITHSGSSYPTNLGDFGVIGFENMDEAQNFVDENGGEIGDFYKQDGWDLWHYKGYTNRAYTDLDYLKKLGDNYMHAYKDNSDYAVDLVTIANNFEGDFCDLNTLIRDIKYIINKVENAADDEVVIIHDISYYETVKTTMMQFSHDCQTYAIGVFVKKD